MHLLKPLKENNNMERIVLATGNKGKIREFERAFSHMNITCVPVKDIVDVPEPEETGTTFMEMPSSKRNIIAKKRDCRA